MSDICLLFAERVAKLRAEREWTYRDARDKTGVSMSALHKIEHGEMKPTLDTAERIASGFGVPLADLIAPPACRQCLDTPPAGFTCRACGANGRDRESTS